MFKHFLILFVTISIVYSSKQSSPVITSYIENKLFCGCTDLELNQKQHTDYQTESIQQKTSIWEKFKFILSESKANSKYLSPEDCKKRISVIKCDDPTYKIKVILASIGIHENPCEQDTSTFASLHSNGKNSCHEALKSTEISSKQCDNKTECSFIISKDFNGICSDFKRQKNFNIVYKCIKEEKKLARTKRFNKFEKDSRNRDRLQTANIFNLPFRWQYDMLKPKSFANNRRFWGTGLYDYYNSYNYNTDYDYGDYYDYLYNDYYDYYPYY